MPLPPEVSRLVPELFRRVGIPYYKGFSADNQRTLSGIVTTGLAGHRAARKQLVADRLRRAPEGGSHLDEFAVAFGFLEESTGNYVVGRYGLMGQYIADAASRHRQFSSERAIRALLIHALLDRHGDCVLPLLAQITTHERADSFGERVRATLESKALAWQRADLPRNAAYREGVRLYSEYLGEWAVRSPWPQRGITPRYARKRSPLTNKTIEGYHGRTAAYASDLMLVVGSASHYSLAPSGEALVSALDEERLSAVGNIGLSPSFEAVHDAFSVDFPRYSAAFAPLTQGRLERLVSSAVLPHKAPVPWEDVPDIEAEYGHIVSNLSEPLTASARLDSVRLGMYLYGVGRGVVPVLDNSSAGSVDINDNAAVKLASGDARKYALGHARSGRRLWSVAVLRR